MKMGDTWGKMLLLAYRLNSAIVYYVTLEMLMFGEQKNVRKEKKKIGTGH